LPTVGLVLQPSVFTFKKTILRELDNAYLRFNIAYSQTDNVLISAIPNRCARVFPLTAGAVTGVGGLHCPSAKLKVRKTKSRRKKMKVRPMNDRVLVVRVEEEKKTPGGIIIPDTAKEKPMEGKVVAAGPGKLDEKGNRIPMELKKGDRVLFSKYGGTEIKIDGVEHLFMRSDDILGVIEK
jgi:chaperonin GroES